jgi:peptidoglycan/LPS O-acetylase OafA/YrhL
MLRGIAAFAVLVHHCWSLSHQPRFTGYWVIEGFGAYGVNLFFLLSGFLLADYFWKPAAERPLSVFYVRRFFRIVPAYYVNLILLMLFFAPAGSLWTRQGLEQLLSNLTFAHYLRPETSSSFGVNGALWTLTIEMVLYVAMPAMALLFAKAPRVAFVALMAIGVGWRLWIGLAGDGLTTFYFGEDRIINEAVARLFIAQQFVGYVTIFGLGIGLKWLLASGRLEGLMSRLPRPTIPVLLGLLVPPALFLVYVERSSFYTHWIWFSSFHYVMAALFLPALLVAAVPLHKGITSPFDRIGVWVGERSYGLYLWHFPIVLALYGRGPLVNAPDTSMIGLKLAVIVALSLLFAHISYVCVERPAQDAARRLTRRILARKNSRSTTDVDQKVPSPAA